MTNAPPGLFEGPLGDGEYDEVEDVWTLYHRLKDKLKTLRKSYAADKRRMKAAAETMEMAAGILEEEAAGEDPHPLFTGTANTLRRQARKLRGGK